MHDTKQSAGGFWKGWLSGFQPFYGVPVDLPDLDRGFERDVEAIASDWQQVGNDLRWAMGQLEHER